MINDKPNPSEIIIYVDGSTSGAGAPSYESSAAPTSHASITRDALVFYTEVPLPFIQQRTPGLQPGSIWVSNDFDEPLPDDFWAGDE
jgi:hypothetical protein